jgi:hypothetical protein
MHAEALAEMGTAVSLTGRGSLELVNLDYVYAVTGSSEKVAGVG